MANDENQFNFRSVRVYYYYDNKNSLPQKMIIF